ncbi:hypothetical protein JCM3770_001373 [Rhodotorula araucariae]
MLRFCFKCLRPGRRHARASPEPWSDPVSVARPTEWTPPPALTRQPSALPHAFTSTPTRCLRLCTLFHPSSRALSTPPPYRSNSPPSPPCGGEYAAFLSSLPDSTGRLTSPCASPTITAIASAAPEVKYRVQQARQYGARGAQVGILVDRLAQLARIDLEHHRGGSDYNGDDEGGGSSDCESFRCQGAAALERARE